MKRSNRRELRNLPIVDYREKDSDDFLDVSSEEEKGQSEDPDDVRPEPAASTPFHLTPPRLLIEGVSSDECTADSVTEDYHSAVTFLGQLSQDSDLQQSSVESDTQTVVEVGSLHQSPQSSSHESLQSSSQESSQIPLNIEHPPSNGENPPVKSEDPPSNVEEDPVVDSEAEMAEIELRKIAAQLQSVMFQIGEMHDAMDDIKLMSNVQIVEMHNELKDLRVRVHTLNAEVNLAGDPNRNYDAEVQRLLGTSKDDLRILKLKVSSIKGAEEDKQTNRDAFADEERTRLQKEREAEEEAKLNAFKRAVQEIEVVRKSLLKLYSVDNLSTERSEVLRREKEKSALAAEFTRMRDLVNNLLCQTDVIPNKESVLSELIDHVSQIDEMKTVYEDKVYRDLVDNDLTEEKLKLAELTKIDVGKFNGELGVGDDYYTFKTKFTKAYINHPRSLTVEWLKNNHLEGPAKEAVGSLNSLEEIWTRLKNNFGDTKQMLTYKFGTIDRMGSMVRRKGFKAKKVYVQALVNIMQDVMDLAKEHTLTGELHYGQQLSKVVSSLENHYQNLWYKILADENVVKEGRWMRMIKFLNSQLTILQLRASEEPEASSSSSRDKDDKEEKDKRKRDNATGGSGSRFPSVNITKKLCNFCGDTHPNANSEFTNCRKFLLMSCKERGGLVRKLKHCLQCLSGKTKFNDPNHVCSDKWICKNVSHLSYQKKLHFLVCEVHNNDDDNIALFGVFQIEVLTAEWQRKIFQGKSGFVSRHTTLIGCNLTEDESKATDEQDVVIADKSQCGTPTFLLQPVPFNGHVFRFMFDNGCEGFLSRKAAVDLLPDKCKENILQGPLKIKGVGDTLVSVPHGYWTVKLPIHTGQLALFSGMCMEVITGKMPLYPVREARKELVAHYKAGGDDDILPQVPTLVGGETDFLFGQQYNWFAPRLLHILPTGLAIYESMFMGLDGTRGCMGGPSKIFEQAERQFLESHPAHDFRVYLQQALSLVRAGIKICVDVNSISSENMLFPTEVAVVDEDESQETRGPVVLLSSKPKMVNSVRQAEYRCEECQKCECLVVLLSSKDKIVNEADEAGARIDYRCEKCRGCSDCKKGEFVQKISLKEEYEQDLIRKSVRVDFDNNETTALLPFISNPETNLCSNEEESLKIYRQQLRLLDKNPAAKEALLEMEAGLQSAGYVDWIQNLGKEQVDMLNGVFARYHMPWRFVFNENSVSTPVRLVFDASSITKSGYSLNDILAKGIKSLNSLLYIFIAFRVRIVGVHTDMKKMYNTIKLRPEHWTFQRYWWHPKLDPKGIPQGKIIKTLIYGSKPSGNQAEFGLRETARMQQLEYPEAADSLIRDTYMDDVLTGADNVEAAENLIRDIDTVAPRGGFSTKGYTVSGRPPLPSLSKDGSSIMALGTKWYPEKDEIQLAFGPLNFMKKHRGKRVVTPNSHEVPDNLTKRICLSKVAELFDVCGLAAPIIAGMKLDIRELVLSDCKWDDVISDTCREQWLKNFILLERIGELRYSRIVVPADAANLEMEIIGAGDASAKMTCAACYVRFKRRNGEMSCQLILSKTKIVPENTTLPRAELMAAILNVHVTEIVKRSVDKICTVTSCTYVLDSEIVLYWICSFTKQLLPFVRNRVIEILRFTDPAQWFHLASMLNPADLGTRKGVKIEDIDRDSPWINGMDWMTLPLPELVHTVLRTVENVKCDKQAAAEIRKEQLNCEDLCHSQYNLVMDHAQSNDADEPSRCYLVDTNNQEFERTFAAKVKERLAFSKYLIDPNRFNFNKVVRIFAIFLKCVRIWYACGARTGRQSKVLQRFSSNADINEKATKQVVEHKSVSAKPEFQNFVILSDTEVQDSLNYFFQKGSEEVKSFVHPNKYRNISVERNGILYFTGRVPLEDLTFKCKMTDTMIDLSTGTFVVPIVEKFSPLSFSILNEKHWYDTTAKHSGVETTTRSTMTVAHILGVRDIAKLFRKNCVRCRFLLKKTVDVEMGLLPSSRLCVAPPYYNTQVDLCGPFTAYSKHNKRTTVKVWIIVYVCATTGMTNLKIMEGYDTTQFLLSFSRFACEVGYPKQLLVDSGSQLVSGCDNMLISMCDIGGKLNREYGIQFEVCPVGGHNFHGRVERKIRTVKESLRKGVSNVRLSILEWETLCAEISNSINNLPVVIGNETDDLENLDLITPNRLRLGRNNSRSPIGVVEVTDRIDRILQLHSDIFNSWWEAWLTSAMPKLVAQPKWFKNDEDLKVGDVVLFPRMEGSLSGEYRYGRIDEVHRGSNDRIRSVVIRYKNNSEETVRMTVRAVRSLIVVHRIDEINIMEELGNAMFVDSTHL